jgi:hypothetical protein
MFAHPQHADLVADVVGLEAGVASALFSDHSSPRRRLLSLQEKQFYCSATRVGPGANPAGSISGDRNVEIGWVATLVGLLLAVGADEFHVNAEIAIEIGLCSVEVEVTDRDAAEILA